VNAAIFTVAVKTVSPLTSFRPLVDDSCVYRWLGLRGYLVVVWIAMPLRQRRDSVLDAAVTLFDAIESGLMDQLVDGCIRPPLLRRDDFELYLRPWGFRYESYIVGLPPHGFVFVIGSNKVFSLGSDRRIIIKWPFGVRSVTFLAIFPLK
jgi:hypothetical protein